MLYLCNNKVHKASHKLKENYADIAIKQSIEENNTEMQDYKKNHSSKAVRYRGCNEEAATKVTTQ